MRFDIFAPPQAELDKWSSSASKDLATAATTAVAEAGAQALKNGRASIAAAGFSRKWQNALRLDVFPKGGVSVNAAAVLRHTIPYAGIFETGGTIEGPLWLPIDRNLPVRSG